MEIGNVLTRAWQIIWRHKVLWIFGILAGCGSTGSTGNTSSYRFSNTTGSGPGNVQLPPGIERFFDELGRVEGWLLFLIIALIIVLVLVLFVLSILLSTVGRIGLIRGTFLADRGADRLPFGELFSASLHYFWRVFAINLLVGIVSFLVILVLGLPLLLCTFGLGLFCLIPLGWLVQLYLEQTNIAIVVEDLGIGAALERGWEVIRTNFGAILLMALILYLGVGLIVGSIIALPLLLIFGPAIAGLVLGSTGNFEAALPGGLVVSLICMAAYLPVLIVLGGILRAYISSAWTLTFLRLTDRPALEEPVVQTI